MGGKGGGGGGGGASGGFTSPEQAAQSAYYAHDQYDKDIQDLKAKAAYDPASKAQWDSWYAPGGIYRTFYEGMYGKDPEPAAAPAAAPAPEAPAPAAPAPEAPAPAEPVAAPANPISSGGAIDAPAGTTGDTLGGAIKNPPSYWTGNINNFKGGSSSKKDSMTTTQT